MFDEVKKPENPEKADVNPTDGHECAEIKPQESMLIEEARRYFDELFQGMREGFAPDAAVEKKQENSEIMDAMEKAGVEYRPIEPASEQRTGEQIVEALGGGDRTEGSCSSLAFAYAGNMAGYEVLDFRGGESGAYFARNDTIEMIAKLPGVESKIEYGMNDIRCTHKLLDSMEEGREYYLATGLHASIVRKNGDQFEYLELQSATNNGWKPLDDDVLAARFGCSKFSGAKLPNFLIDVDSLSRSTQFHEVLGYINTAESDQMKGADGYVR